MAFPLSCGKYRAFPELRELDTDIAPEDIREMSMRELRGLIAALTAETKIPRKSAEDTTVTEMVTGTGKAVFLMLDKTRQPCYNNKVQKKRSGFF